VSSVPLQRRLRRSDRPPGCGLSKPERREIERRVDAELAQDDERFRQRVKSDLDAELKKTLDDAVCQAEAAADDEFARDLGQSGSLAELRAKLEQARRDCEAKKQLLDRARTSRQGRADAHAAEMVEDLEAELDAIAEDDARRRIDALGKDVSQADRELREATKVIEKYEEEQEAMMKGIEDDFAELTRALGDEIMALNQIRNKRKEALFEQPSEEVVAAMIAQMSLQKSVFNPIEQYLEEITG
jgi:hypothetical protein